MELFIRKYGYKEIERPTLYRQKSEKIDWTCINGGERSYRTQEVRSPSKQKKSYTYGEESK